MEHPLGSYRSCHSGQRTKSWVFDFVPDWSRLIIGSLIWRGDFGVLDGWLKTRARWRETSVHEQAAHGNSLVTFKVTYEDSELL
jgi:hypothetical protein